MDKKQVIERLCGEVCTLVGEHMHHEYAHDCFCHRSLDDSFEFQFSEEVFNFIKNAVQEKIKREYIEYCPGCRSPLCRSCNK